jgi:hypothetical protein
MPFLDALQSSAFARAIAESRWAAAIFSSVHLVGFTVVLGSALVANLRLMGALLPDRPSAEIVRPTARGLIVGIVISVTTGFVLFAPRAVAAANNSTFRLKMFLLVTAAIYHLVIQRTIVMRQPSPAAARALGGVGILLWVGLAVAGCAFILFE